MVKFLVILNTPIPYPGPLIVSWYVCFTDRWMKGQIDRQKDIQTDKQNEGNIFGFSMVLGKFKPKNHYYGHFQYKIYQNAETVGFDYIKHQNQRLTENITAIQERRRDET